MDRYSILFVCTGNICRSPTAEGVFRYYIEESGLSEHFLIDSAGTHGYHVGEPPDSRAIVAAVGRGIRMDDLRARQLAARDYERFDLILAMDGGHYDILKRTAERLGDNVKARIELFMDYAPDAGRVDVPDPYYGDKEDFEYALDLVEQGAQGLLKHLKESLGI